MAAEVIKISGIRPAQSEERSLGLAMTDSLCLSSLSPPDVSCPRLSWILAAFYKSDLVRPTWRRL
jgi:hypothetical protein